MSLYNLKYCDLSGKYILAQLFMNLLLPVYVHVHNIKVCSSKCLWGRKYITLFRNIFLQGKKQQCSRNNKHDFFSCFLNHSPFLVKNAKRKEKNVFFMKNPPILRLTNVYNHVAKRVEVVDGRWCMVWTFELVVL